MATALDASVIVAALQSWHKHHAAAQAAVDGCLSSGEPVLLPSRALLESFSVMTRLPVPHRLNADVALTLLEKTFKESVQVVNLPAEEHWNLLRDLRDRGVSGGAVYDADIIECSHRAGADKYPDAWSTVGGNRISSAPRRRKSRRSISAR